MSATPPRQSERVVADPAECRAMALEAMDAYSAAIESGHGFERMSNPRPGDLVLEVTTAFRWMANHRLAPGEALGWLLRVEDDGTHVLRPVYEAEGEFRWSNCKFIVVEEGTDAA